MRFSLSNPTDAGKALDYLLELTKKGSEATVTRVSPKRSLNQNNYLYLLLTEFGRFFGYTIDEAKTVYKRDINPGIYVYDRNGHKFLRSSADLTTEEMTRSIDRLREFSAEQGHPLPAATDQDWLKQIENEAERERFYLK